MNRFGPISLLRKAYVRFVNKRFFDRYVLATLKFVFGPAYMTLLGYLNASDISRGKIASLTVAYTAGGGSADFVRFLVHMAERSSVPLPATAAIDVVINASANEQPAHYASLARMFHSRINLHLVWDRNDAERVLPTLVDAASVERIRADLSPRNDTIIINDDLIGRLRPRQFYANQAREFLKTHGWAKYYCALSLPDGWSTEDVCSALSRVTAEQPGWRFVLFESRKNVVLQSAQADGNIIFPCCAGVEFSMQVALAVECDAYFGQCDHFGVAALLTGKTAGIVRSSETSAIQIGRLKNAQSFDEANIGSMASYLAAVLQRAQADLS